MRHTKHAAGRVRIIGGRWRRRILSFPSQDDLRPSMDAVRETLFNWLGHHTEDAQCLDLFAGSGALGFEALSRGAKHCVFVDRSARQRAAIWNNARQLKTDQTITVCHSHYPKQMPTFTHPFDLVFLDPPFTMPHCIRPCIQWLLEKKYLHAQSILYIESGESMQTMLETLPLSISRQKKQGNIFMVLGRLERDRTRSSTKS